MHRTSSDPRHHLARTCAVRALGAAAVAAALAAAVAACSGGGRDAPPAAPASAVSAEHDDADVLFAQQMIVHHRGAVEMAELAQDRAEDPAVRDLAGRVLAAQGPEIVLMTGWLEAWGAPAATDDGGHGGHGAMSTGEDDAAALEGASGATFDRLFLERMTAHHRGAVDMARTEQSEGSDPRAVELAGAVIESQTAEIAEMDHLLRALGA